MGTGPRQTTRACLGALRDGPSSCARVWVEFPRGVPKAAIGISNRVLTRFLPRPDGSRTKHPHVRHRLPQNKRPTKRLPGNMDTCLGRYIRPTSCLTGARCAASFGQAAFVSGAVWAAGTQTSLAPKWTPGFYVIVAGIRPRWRVGAEGFPTWDEASQKGGKATTGEKKEPHNGGDDLSLDGRWCPSPVGQQAKRLLDLDARTYSHPPTTHHRALSGGDERSE